LSRVHSSNQRGVSKEVPKWRLRSAVELKQAAKDQQKDLAGETSDVLFWNTDRR
jgi:hypothetical protein